MAAMRGGPRLAVGSAAWIAEERSSAAQIAQSEVEEFSFSARNEVDWLNEHMAEIFSENQLHVAELFKTPGKLRGRTPRTARKANPAEARAPLSDIFSATPKGAPNPFTSKILAHAQTPRIKVAEDKARPANAKAASSARQLPQPSPRPQAPAVASLGDSGYHGSQEMDVDDFESKADHVKSNLLGFSKTATPGGLVEQASPTREDTFESAREEQTNYVTAQLPDMSPTRPTSIPEDAESIDSPTHRFSASPNKLLAKPSSPAKSSPQRPRPAPASQQEKALPQQTADVDSPAMAPLADEMKSPSDGSSPIRPIVRKSSLNFASLPAREPMNANKSLGARMSRTSHLDQSRQSYYNRHTHGKSLGNVHRPDPEDDVDEMDVDGDLTVQRDETIPNIAAHNKTYTQRLQDQITMLGQSQSAGPRPSKSIANLAPQSQGQSAPQVQPNAITQTMLETKPLPPSPKRPLNSTPGAFPADVDDNSDEDEGEWIAPPTTVPRVPVAPSPRPVVGKSYSTDVMEGLVGRDTVGGAEFAPPVNRPSSPRKDKEPLIPERTTSALTHGKSASVPLFSHAGSADIDYTTSPKKVVSVSNPTLPSLAEDDGASSTPSSKSPSRTFRDSPLKQVKNKLSSILKSSKGLLASSAAISAEGKSSLLSPSTTKLGYHAGPSTDSLLQPMYPDLSQYATNTPSRPGSPARSNSRRTRASAEREKREAKEAKRLADQNDKLEKIRQKEREKARVFSKEQEKMIEMEKQVASQKEQDRIAQEAAAAAQRAAARELAAQEAAFREAAAAVVARDVPSSPARSPPRSPARATRTSPRKAKAQAEAEQMPAAAQQDAVEMDQDAMVVDNSVMPPPSAPRSAAPPSSRGQTLKRPTKPSKDLATKSRQAPTVIRVNTNSAQQSQFHPSNSVLAATLHDTLTPQAQGIGRQLNSKASQASLTTKPSLQSLKSSVSSSGRPKALELAAKRKEQEERDAQKKREAKLEMERKRAALQEEERKAEQQRRLEAERQKEDERKQAAAAAQVKKDAQRQAAIEKAKQTRAPPPPVRSQPHGPPEHSLSEKPVARPPSRLGSTMHQESQAASSGRPVNTVLSNASSKMAPKRPLQQESAEEASRPALPRNGPSFQSKEAKRMRMSEEFDDDIEMADSQRNIKGPPVRPSGGFKKELPTKSMFSSSYANAAPQGPTRDLFKATVTAQHNSAMKTAAHPLDMAQVSKGAIPFAPNPNAASHQQPQPQQQHKTPARPGGIAPSVKSSAKTAQRSSPRFQNGDSIELPEIQTDDEDDDDDAHIGVAPWADSPDLRRALMRQETMDPMQIFGAPAQLNMEEVFSKSKDRWHKFRARTSSANWSGADRLTEEDIRKDLIAREKMRREGGWTYELSRDMA